MLKLDIIDFEIGHEGLGCSVDGVPSLENLNTVSFTEESLTQVIGGYFDDNWGNGYDTEDAVARWLNDKSKKHWFGIKKYANGDYYYVVGDQTGIVYYEQIYRIKVDFNDYEVLFNEDDDYYYINFIGTRGEYDKKDWTLEGAILDMERVLEESFVKII